MKRMIMLSERFISAFLRMTIKEYAIGLLLGIGLFCFVIAVLNGWLAVLPENMHEFCKWSGSISSGFGIVGVEVAYVWGKRGDLCGRNKEQDTAVRGKVNIPSGS